MNNKKIIGWERLHSGNWRPIEDQGDGYHVTEAFVNCNECHRCISGFGGPKTYALCIRCFNEAEKNK
jgi:hypothetical protein